MEQVQSRILHLPGKVADGLAAQHHEEIVHIVVDIRLNGIGALQRFHQCVQLLCRVIALVDLVPDLTGKVSVGVNVFGLCDQLVIGFHSAPYAYTI